MTAKSPGGSPRLAPGSRLGKYELLRYLARGGMAELYLARASGIEGFEKIVVVKRIRPEHAADKDFVQLFLDEARLAATLHHPNIAQVYDVGIAGGQYFFAMEFVFGEDVRAILRHATAQQQAVPLAEALTIVIGVCSALHYAHEKVGMDGKPLGIIHRDVTPSNIIATYDGQVKLIDFGIAKATTRTFETRCGSIRGKLHYMSPEQCCTEPLDRRADIFALSIVLYELTTSASLFRGESDYEVMKQIVEQPVPPPSHRKPCYPPALEKIVLKGLARKREDRWQTAQELQVALEEFARDERLAISTVGLERYMGAQFADKIAAWRMARAEGKRLGDHLASLPRPVDHTPSGGVQLTDSPLGAAFGAAGPGEPAPGEAEIWPEIPSSLDALVSGPDIDAAAPAWSADEEILRPRSRARAWAAIAGGIVACAVLVVAAFVFFTRPRPLPVVEARPADAAAPEMTVQVVSVPAGAMVTLDGRRQELLPPNLYRVPRGPALKVRVELEGHQPFEQDLAFGPTEATRAIRAVLKPIKYEVESASAPAATVAPKRSRGGRSVRRPSINEAPPAPAFDPDSPELPLPARER